MNPCKLLEGSPRGAAEAPYSYKNSEATNTLAYFAKALATQKNVT